MNRLRPFFELALIFSAIILGWLFCEYATAAKPSSAKTVFQLPINGTDARGFCLFDGHLVMMDHPNRMLYLADADGKLTSVESTQGWAISDVVVFGRTPLYCSRNRVLQYVNGKVREQKIDGTSNLRSIATDGVQIYLLDTGATDSSILAVNPRTGLVSSRFKYDGIRPVDIAVHNQQLFVLDMGDRSVHILSRSGTTKLRMQLGPGVASGCGGLVFIADQLYIHEADYQRLRPLNWRVESNLVSSWMHPMRMTFVQESRNVSKDESMTIDFHVPVPSRTPSQVVGELSWSEEPNHQLNDRYGQAVAKFTGLNVPPESDHRLSYSVDVYARAIQYDPPPAPLDSLDRIPQDVKDLYLQATPVYQMDTQEMQTAASEAKRGRNGKPASDVRTLITNIAWYATDRFRYAMDESWDDAKTSWERGTGSCSEYAFVFASLCRLNGIPTRLVGGIQFADYRREHESDRFHRWNEVYFPNLGWIPVDVTKFDDAEPHRRDFEFLFGTPGYVITLSQGDVDPEVLGMTYYIRRRYRGGKRVRHNFVRFEPIGRTREVVKTLRFQ